MRHDDRACDRETEAGSALPGSRIVSVELLEDPLTVGFGDARPMIGDAHLDGRPPADRRDVDLAPRRGEADRVLDDVRQDLSDLDGVGIHRWKVGSDRRPDHDVFQ